MAGDVTVGIDIGTTSVKAIAADADGTVVARTRVPHPLLAPAPVRLEHDINRAWRAGVEQAYADVSHDVDVVAVEVAAMVPSLGALTDDGHAAGPGLLYGDERGRRPGVNQEGNPAESGEMLGFLAWLRGNCPEATRFWPAQAVANHALCGRGVIDTTTAFTAYPLFDGARWDPALAAQADVTPEQLPDVVVGMDVAGRVGDSDDGGPVLGGGTIDAMGEQVVAGADDDGDVLVICGTTLITWAVMSDWIERPGLWTIPHTAPGKILIGGPSNAGGLFLGWAAELAGPDGDHDSVAPDNLPVWLPYVRGERTPLHNADLRASLHGLDLTHTSAHVRRAAYEAAGFVVRHHLERAGNAIAPRRIVATGGGTRVAAWVRALADCTGLPVDVVAVPEGGALGAAFIARCVAGLEAQMSDGSRWAQVERTIDPDPAWSSHAARRYEVFRDLTDAAPGPAGD